MPIFEYRCAQCGHVFEHFWRGAERREELRCPECGAERVEKIVSLCGVSGRSSFGADLGTSSCAPTGG